MEFGDTGGFRIADLCCPVHGIGGTDPGDGPWEREAAERWQALRDYLEATAAECEAGLPAGAGDDLLTGVRTGRALACRAALRKMRELEDSP